MTPSLARNQFDSDTLESPDPSRGQGGAVSWAAVLAGATAAAALSLILLLLGMGLGMSSVSPWAASGVSATTLTVSTILWLSFVQVAASGMGGYIAGRLRAKWVAIHSDEAYFRDTAHGFLAWGVATLVTASVLASAVGNIIGSGAQAGVAMVSGAAQSATSLASTPATANASGGSSAESDATAPLGYWVDTLFRKAAVTDSATAPPARAAATGGQVDAGAAMSSSAEAARILATSLVNGTLTTDDTAYLGQLVAQRTGVPQAHAQSRVTETFGKLQANLQASKDKAKQIADKARKASAYGALWLFVSLLIGAFVASMAATLGGRHRDL